MYLCGQDCPVARASEILADRWTPLIVRELLAMAETVRGAFQRREASRA